jgi:ABC-type lipoprotein release transport system permease subunit
MNLVQTTQGLKFSVIIAIVTSAFIGLISTIIVLVERKQADIRYEIVALGPLVYLLKNYDIL